MTRAQPRVIAFEGVDGAGKSTVLGLVAKHLRASGVPLCVPRLGKEHRSPPLRAIRQLTRDRTNLELCAQSEALLYVARETQVLEQYVRPAIARGETVLLDRAMLTSVVLGSYGRGLELERCELIAGAASGGLGPDLTLIFDVDPRTGRIRKRLDKIRKQLGRDGGRKGLAGSGLKERMRDGYKAIAERDGLPVFHAERSAPAQVAERVIALLEHGRFDEPEDDSKPWWLVDPEASFQDAVASLPALEQLYFTRRMPIGRELRAAWYEREPALTVWATDLDDPLLARASKQTPELVLARLSGLPRAQALRERCASSHPVAVARSLVRVPGPEADQLRARLAEQAPGAVVESLSGRSDLLALELRDRLWKRADIYERCASLRLCDHDGAWRRRERLLDEDPAVLIPTLAGLAPERVDPILDRYAAMAPKQVIRALRGRADAHAHALRIELLDTGREVVDSLAGLDDAASWSLRERCTERWPSTVALSLDGLRDRPRVQALLDQCELAAPDDLFLERRLCQLDGATASLEI